MNERDLQKLMKLMIDILCRENRVAVRTLVEEGSQILPRQNITNESLTQTLEFLERRNLIRLDIERNSIEILREIFTYIDWSRV